MKGLVFSNALIQANGNKVEKPKVGVLKAKTLHPGDSSSVDSLKGSYKFTKAQQQQMCNKI